MDCALNLSDSKLSEVPVENGLVRAAHSAITPSKSVLEKRPDGLNHAITARQSGPPTTGGTVGMTKVWDSSGARGVINFPDRN
jgi:hypothetical protein